jgi:nucleoside-diphosphate-sugar epimerase
LSEDRLHVVFGAGQVGRALATRLAELRLAVRAVSRHQPQAPLDGVEWLGADAGDPDAAADAAKGASVVDHSLNAPYRSWPEFFPPLQRSVLGARPNAPVLCW